MSTNTLPAQYLGVLTRTQTEPNTACQKLSANKKRLQARGLERIKTEKYVAKSYTEIKNEKTKNTRDVKELEPVN